MQQTSLLVPVEPLATELVTARSVQENFRLQWELALVECFVRARSIDRCVQPKTAKSDVDILASFYWKPTTRGINQSMHCMHTDDFRLSSSYPLANLSNYSSYLLSFLI